MNALALHGITKNFGATQVLRGVDLEVAEGEFVAIVGPSGCGKSTLLRVISGLESHYGGTVSIRGRAVDALPPGRRDVAMVFQSYALYPQMTVAENIALPLAMRRLTRFERLPGVRSMSAAVKAKRAGIAASVKSAASMVRLEGLLDRKPKQLSGGQRQRVALARALVRQPQLFLLDEPLSNLDANLRNSTRIEIADLQRRLGVATLFVTHDQTEAMTMADRIVVMMDGAVVQVGTAKDLYERPDDLRVAQFIGSTPINLLPGKIANGFAWINGSDAPHARIEDAPDGAATFAARAEHLRIVDPAEATLHGSVRRTEYLGSDRFVILGVSADGETHEITVRAQQDSPDLSPGAPAGLSFSQPHLHLFGADGRRLAAQPATVHPINRHQLTAAV